ncbi:MAG: NAD(P)-dependent oxidoreductase [Alkalilacustris sp.]
MRILVLGATGGTGRAFVTQALAAGHGVTALVRDAAKMPPAPGLEVVVGDATDAALLSRIVPGHDAFLVSLGERPHPLAFLPGPQRWRSTEVCSRGTAALLKALGGKGRIGVVSAYGVGATRSRAPWYFRLYFDLFLSALFADKERQEAALAASEADYVIAQPVGLTDGAATGRCLISPEGDIRKATVTRADVAAFLLRELTQPTLHRACVAVSG